MLTTRNIVITPEIEILALLSKLDEFRGAWRALGTLAPDRLLIEQNKQGCYIAPQQTQGTIRTQAPNWQPWIAFFLSSLCSQVKSLEAKIKREQLLLAARPELSIQLLTLALAREHGCVTVASAEAQTRANRHPIKLHIRKLLAAGQLVQPGAGRGAWYSPAMQNS